LIANITTADGRKRVNHG